jgi:TatD DNase family protein
LFPDKAASTLAENSRAYFSVGLHPWYINDEADGLLKKVGESVMHPNVVFVGEAGLDKNIQVSISKQEQIFEAQLLIAKRAKKPLIIHCVKAYQEILSFKKENPDIAFIFHAFRGKLQLAKQLLDHGCYLSVGDKAKFIPETINYIPLENLFIETDESSVNIGEIYREIAIIKGIAESELVDGCWDNFFRLTSLE